jgi:prevent-host-death family protein
MRIVNAKQKYPLFLMAIIAIRDSIMRSVNVAELKNRLSTYLAYARNGEVIVIRDRNLPVARLIPFTAEDPAEEDLMLAASGAMRLPTKPLDLHHLGKMPRATVRGTAAVQAILDEREEGR